VTELLYRKEPANRGFHWFLEKKNLLQYYGLIDQKESFDQLNGQSKVNQNDNRDKLNNQLESTIDFFKKQLEEKDVQLSKEQDRNRELQIMLGREQEKVRLLEAPKKTKGVVSGLLAKFGL
jgi:hypothetical protein